MGPYLLDSGCAGDVPSSVEGAGVCACPMRERARARARVCARACVRACICVCACLCMCMRACVCACVWVDGCVCVPAHARVGAWEPVCEFFSSIHWKQTRTPALIAKQVTCQTSDKQALRMTSADTSLLRYKRSPWC